MTYMGLEVKLHTVTIKISHQLPASDKREKHRQTLNSGLEGPKFELKLGEE
jgi:hypothetical protein